MGTGPELGGLGSVIGGSHHCSMPVCGLQKGVMILVPAPHPDFRESALASGVWTMASKAWTVVSGAWIMASGAWMMASKAWTMASGAWTMASGSGSGCCSPHSRLCPFEGGEDRG